MPEPVTQPPTKAPPARPAPAEQTDPKLGAHVVPHPSQHDVARDVVQHGAATLADDRQRPLDDATGAPLPRPGPLLVADAERKPTDKELFPNLDIVQKPAPDADRPFVAGEGDMIRVGNERVRRDAIKRTTHTESGLRVVTDSGEIVVPTQHVDAFNDVFGSDE